MSNITPTTLHRIASFLEDGGRPLTYWENRIAARALALAAGDNLDAAAVLRVQADR